jgi:LacI family transcriptional regulator
MIGGGMSGVTIKDIAKRSNLSHTTVSRVLNRRADAFISEATRARILELAREMGYQPNGYARALATGRTHTIALALDAVIHPLATVIMNYLMVEVEKLGYDLIVTKVVQDSVGPNVAITKWPVDGTIYFNNTPPVAGEEKGERSRAVVSMGSGCVKTLDHVEVDLSSGALDAMEHLVEIGCKRIAFLTMPHLEHEGDARRDAYEAVVAKAGLESEHILQPDNVVPRQQSIDARTAVLEHVRKHGCPNGLFARNDHMALGAYSALREAGYRIPEDVALVGCDGIEEIKYLDSPLTTIEQPTLEMCALGLTFLHQRIQNPDLPNQTAELKTRLVRRKSTAR